MSSRLWLGAVVFVLAVTPVAPVASADDVPLATYRAVHDLVVESAAAGAASALVSGRLVTEFTGSQCAGYATKTRFVSDGVDRQGNNLIEDQRTTTLETSDGRFEFTNEIYAGNALSLRSAGTAQRTENTVTVLLKEPDHRSLNLDPGTAFPTEQTVRVLEAARAGKHFLTFDVYDGSEDGTVVLFTATVIGAPLTVADDATADAGKMAAAGFVGVRRWPVTVSYFDTGSGASEEPFFVLTGVMYENGILTDLRMDYGKFALVGTLTQIEKMPAGLCPG